jgi:hypothetical protein
MKAYFPHGKVGTTSASEELTQLEANILRDGCRDPLVVWGEILIDGHNRHDICARHGLHFNTVPADFPDRDHALLWINQNQLGRRNLTDDQRACIADEAAEIESRIAMRERAAKGTPAREAKKLTPWRTPRPPRWINHPLTRPSPAPAPSNQRPLE